MTDPLAILPSCRGCGACCEHIGTPPGYSAGFAPGGPALGLMWDGDPDRFLAMPDGPRRELADYYAALDRGETPDRAEAEMPCLWYDGDARRCRHHEWRPAICRDFDPGEEGCLGWRAGTGRFAACPE